nr:hypothetical protein [Nitrospiraceae bacterium]
MILLWLIIVPFAGGVAAWILGLRGRGGGSAARWASIAALAVDLALLAAILAGRSAAAGRHGDFFLEARAGWVPQLGISI